MLSFSTKIRKLHDSTYRYIVALVMVDIATLQSVLFYRAVCEWYHRGLHTHLAIVICKTHAPRHIRIG